MDWNYALTASPGVVAELTQRTLIQHGYRVRCDGGGDRFHLESSLPIAFGSILFRSLPHRFVADVESTPDGSRLIATFRYCRGYSIVLVISACLSLFCLTRVVNRLFGGRELADLIDETAIFAVLGTLTLLFITLRLILVEGAGMRLRLQRTLFANAAGAGTAIHSIHARESLSRHLVIAFVYLALIVVSAASGFIASGATVPTDSRAVPGVLGCAFVLALVLLVILVARIPGSAERVNLMLPSLSFVVALIPLLGTEVMFSLIAMIGFDRWREVVAEYPKTVWFFLGPLLACLLLFIYFITLGLQVSKPVIQIASDTKARLNPTQASAAITQSSRFAAIRYAVVIIWTIPGVCLLVLSARITSDVMQWMAGERSGPVAATAWLTSTACGQDVRSSVVVLITSFVWTVLMLFSLGAVACSVSHLLISERRIGNTDACNDSAERSHLLEIVNGLSLLTGLPTPDISVDRSLGCFAFARVDRFRRDGEMIVIGKGCCNLLNTDEMRALIAHEWAHHVNGDCKRHALLRLVARLTLFGDGMVAVFERSFDCEMNADKTAVKVFQADRLALSSCLRKLAAVSSLNNPGVHGLAAHQSAQFGTTWQEHAQASNHRPALLEGLRWWWRLYTSDTELSYWHPTVAERIAALRPPICEEDSSSMIGPKAPEK